MAVLNKRVYIYPNIIGLNNNSSTYIYNDDIIKNINGSISWNSDTIAPILFAQQTNSHTIILNKDREVYIPVTSNYLYHVSELDNKNVTYVAASHSFTKILDEEVSYTDCYNGAYVAVTKNGNLYLFGRSNNNQLPASIVPEGTDIVPPTKIILPNNEKAFMAKQWASLECFIVTLKGNLYRYVYKTEKFIKFNISNVTHMGFGDCHTPYLVTEDGSLYRVSDPNNSNAIQQIPEITDAKSAWGDNSNCSRYSIVLTHSNKVHFMYYANIIYTYELEDGEVAVAAADSATYLNTAKFTTASGKLYYFTRPDNSYDYTLNKIYENLDLRDVIIEDPGIYINLDIDNYEYEYNPDKTGVTYKFRFRLTQDLNISGTSNVVNYVTEYSTDNGATWTQYNHVDCQGSKTYTLADVDRAAEELSAIAETAANTLKGYLDTLIGTITLPGNKGNGELTYEISGLKSGKKFYVKTTFTKGAVTNTNAVINYTTVYGTTLNYGTIYNQGTVNITAAGKEFSALTWSSDGKTVASNGPVNYKNHTAILTSMANDSSKGFFTKVKALPAIQMFNVAIPGSVAGAETAATKYTTDAGAGGGNGANVYYYKVAYTQDDTTDTTNKIKVQVTYGNASNTVTTNTYYTDTYTILSSNYTTAVADIQNIAKGQVTELKKFLNIPDVASNLPATVERTYTKNNFAFKITVERAAKSAAEKNIIITTPKVDGLIYGSAVTQTFHGTVTSAIDIINAKANELVSAIEKMCSAAPANTSETYDKGNCHFTIGTNYSKSANSLAITVNTMCDGVVHKTSTITIASNSNKIGTYLTGSGGAVPAATTDLTSLKNVLANCPVNTDVAYAKGNMNFTITKQYTKTAGNTTATYKVLVDGVEYQAATNVTLRPAQANLSADLTTLGNEAAKYVTNAQTVLNGCPVDASEDKTKNGFAYTLGVGYTKTAGTPKATSFATLDGTAYSSNTYDFKITNFAANKTTLTTNATTGKNTLQSIIDDSPANTSEVKTYNGFKYNVKTQYSKAKGQNVVTIKTLFDDQTYKSETKTVDPGSFANDLNAITLQASNRKTELLNILDDSPKNTDTTIYTIDGFKYYVGATFAKAADKKQVTIKIKLDGADKETYTANINGSTTAADIAAIASNASTKVTNLKNSLRGLPLQSVPWTVNGFNFNLKVKYDKNLDDGKITISSYIDDTKHLSDEVYDFVVDNIDTYSSKGDAKITALKNVVNNSPANTEKNVSKNNLSFKIGINYEKAKDSSTVYVYSILDGNKLAGPHTVNFDPNNIAAISTKGATDLTLLENTLNACPANYTTNYNVGNMGFTIGSAFSKTAGNSTVTIQTSLDGDNYGSAATQTFNINDIGALATKAQEKELALKAILDGCPKDSLEKYVYKKFAFNIEKLYSKTAGYHVVTSMVKLDGVQYDQYHQENFNVSNIASLENSNNKIVEALKSRLISVIPEDVHTTYSRNNFNFTIDAYYSKKEGSDVVDIEYNIDSADLSNDSDPISFSAASDMSHVNNG